MSDFKPFAKNVEQTFQNLAKNDLFTVNITGDELYEAYLAAFPEGSNPLFRERTEHDCSCCKNFIRNLGAVVGIGKNGEIKTVWDNYVELEYPYNVVAEKLRHILAVGAEVKSLYKSSELRYGNEVTHEVSGDKVINWNHFHAVVPKQHYYGKSVASEVGEKNTSAEMLLRALTTLQDSAFVDVKELIDAGQLYRGDEFKWMIQAFVDLKKSYHKNPTNFHWLNHSSNVARIRNTAFGTLLVDLSEGLCLEESVRSFESKVAPTNYKRTTALVTPKMVEEAVSKIRELGFEESLKRRFANLTDVSINDVLWADAAAQSVMKDTLMDTLLKGSGVKKSLKKLHSAKISVDDFLNNVLPKTAKLEVMVKNSLVNNLMSITAPVDNTSPLMFKWDNGFAWSYNGNITDSIKDKVKRAGGNVDAKLRVSLAWFNPDDLDLYCDGPDGIIYFGDRKGILDVDMNAYGVSSDTAPVENLQWKHLKDGDYRISVKQYKQRTLDRPGFVIEMENNGNIQHFTFNQHVQGVNPAINFKVKNGEVVDLQVHAPLVSQSSSREEWGVNTETFVRVETVMLSPNYWGNSQVGNKHYMFLLEGCKNPENTRGIYNEFLTSELDKHRKVLELVGSKTMCPVADEQLSGLGFSSTIRNVAEFKATDYNGRVETFEVQF